MERIKCITFDKKAQDSLPEHIKAKMKADREKAQQIKVECADCGFIHQENKRIKKKKGIWDTFHCPNCNSESIIRLIDNVSCSPKTFKVDSNFQTPIPVCEYMVDMVPPNAINVLEPTPGVGNIVNVLNLKNRYQVIAADDFFLIDKNEKYDCIVMNPPFSSKSAFMQNAPEGLEITGMKLGYYILTECMKMSDNIIALMPWYTLSDSDVRMRCLKQFGIKSLTALPRKTFQYARIQTVIIELEKGYQHETIFRTFSF